jgi:plastocyanin
LLTDVIISLDGDAGGAKRPSWLDKATVGMRLREFEPHVQIIGVGGSVAYPNQDPFSHNVFSNSSLGAFDLGLYRSGKTRSATFSAPGVYAVYCNIHARMANYVVAVRTPYVTRVRTNGTFEIANVPAGTWTLRVWHERAAEHIETIRVTTEDLALTLALDARGYVAKAHSNKFGQPYAATRADRY